MGGSLQRRLLVVLAHPDDESFAIGGTLAKYAIAGVQISLVSATKGEAGIPSFSPDATARIRERELLMAAQVLGIDDVRFLGWADGKLKMVDQEIIIRQLVGILLDVRPHAVITFGPDGISGHPDHVAIHHLTTETFKRLRLLARLYYIAPSEATRQGCGVAPSEETAGGSVAVIDVSDYLITKARAIQSHVSQNPLYTGKPEEAAQHLTCHEFFTLAYPRLSDMTLIGLFGPLPTDGSEIHKAESRTGYARGSSGKHPVD